MPTTRIKEKLSTLVSSQLPEYIQTEYTTFVSFLEAYYEFLEQDQGSHELIQNARSYHDIDTTIDSFVKYFLKQYCENIPSDVLYNKRALVKNIQDLYNNKGNEKSYQLLFRILYDKPVELFYPSTQILKASDGKWVQKTAFFMRTIVGDGSTIAGKSVVISSPSTKFLLLIKSRKQAISSTGVSPTIHEYVFDNSKNIPVNVGDIIEYGGFRGEVVGAPAQATVINPGSGFKVGDVLPLTAGLGTSARLKVIKVDSNGGILNVQFINFGIGYTSDFYNFFTATPATGAPATFSYTGGTASITESTQGFIDQGAITTSTYAESGYFAEAYDGSVVREFFTSTSVLSTSSPGQAPSTVSISSGLPTDAAIYVKIGSKLNYPGYYESTDGFLSDEIYLEDQDYYQPYSYVLKLDERLSLYKKAVLDLLHPAGTKLFGQLQLTAEIDNIAEITTSLRLLTSNFQDQIAVQDSAITFTDINKTIPLTVTVEDNGYIFNASYADVTYFAEDYAGDVGIL